MAPNHERREPVQTRNSRPEAGARERERRARRRGSAAQVPASNDDTSRLRRPRSQMDPEELWADLRAGARNAAGVTWQVNVCVYLLVASYANELPFVRITPEGFEDADCEDGRGKRTFIQMKEMLGGEGRLTASRVSAALEHAEISARGADIVVITDASLGSGLTFTGWDGSVQANCADAGVREILDALARRGVPEAAARDIIDRAYLIRLPYRVREVAEKLLAQAANCHATVAGIAISRLVEVFARHSADQRGTKSDTAYHLAISDVDAALTEAQDAVDAQGLDTAVLEGICSPADFLTPASVPARTFYQGVDGNPNHISAHLDVLRPVELSSCADGLDSERSVLITGPSGCGKSVLMWRAARDLMSSARVVRVHRVEDSNDAQALARHVRLLRPSTASPVLVVADNVGRPTAAAWPEAAALLREVTETFLLGAARTEDFHPALLVGATRVVRPFLDAETASAIAQRLIDAGIPVRVHVGEALEGSNGLLMEFVALLSTGQRLRQVLAQQAAGLKAPGRELQRAAARLLTAAHTLGLSVQSDRLAAVLVPLDNVDKVGDALTVLKDEHLAVVEGQRWRGLHELRSSVLTELLHENPPPTMASTWVRVAEAIDPNHTGWMIRHLSERDPASLAEVLPVLQHVLSSPDATAKRAAVILEGLERADNTLYTRAALPIWREYPDRHLTLREQALLSYSVRNQGLQLDGKEFLRIRAIASKLPARRDFDELLKTVGSDLSADALENLLSTADLDDKIRLIEAGREHLMLPVPLVRDLIANMELPGDPQGALRWSRLMSACFRHVPECLWEEVFGSVEDRAKAIASADPCVLSVVLDETSEVIKLERLAPLVSQTPPSLDWDIPPRYGNDELNNETVAVLQRIADGCPELKRLEITTVTASGVRYLVRGSEPGHKAMERARLEGREGIRLSVGFQAALRRATSAATWTEVLERQIEIAAELSVLAHSAPERLKPRDSDGRRKRWSEELRVLGEQLNALMPRPTQNQGDPETPMSTADDMTRTEDGITNALIAVKNSLNDVLVEPRKLQQRAAGITMTLRNAAAKLRESSASGSAVLDQEGSAVPQDLIFAVEMLGNLTAAIHLDRNAADRLGGANPSESAKRVWESVRVVAREAGLAILTEVLSSCPDVEIQAVVDPDPLTWAIDDIGWLVTASLATFDAAAEALDRLNDEQRSRLGANVVLLAAVWHGSIALPLVVSTSTRRVPGELDSSSGWVSAGIGVRMSHSQSGSPLPLPSDVISTWAAAGSMPVVQAPVHEAVERLIDKLIQKSWELSRLSQRRLPHDSGESEILDVNQLVNSAESEVSQSDADDGWSPSRESALRVLVQQVRDEEAGSTSLSLAGVLQGMLSGEPMESEALILLGALGVFSLPEYAASI